MLKNATDIVNVARRSVLIAAAIQPDSLDMVLTRLLVSTRLLYFSLTNRNALVCRALAS